MAKDFSPEERLLRLIKGKRESAFNEGDMVRLPPQGAASDEQEEAASGAYERLTVPGEKKEDIEKFQAQKQEQSKRPKTGIIDKLPLSFNTRYIYILIAIILLSSFIFFIMSSLSGREEKELQSLKTLVASISKEAEETAVTQVPIKQKQAKETVKKKDDSSFEDYQKLLEQKSVFVPVAGDRRNAQAVQGPGLREMVKDIRLVGIIPGDEPQAIIEDRKNGQTLFLKVGEQIGDMEIRQISDGRVILGYNEETITLSL